MAQSEAIAMPQSQFETGTAFLQAVQCRTEFRKAGIGISRSAFFAAGSPAQRHMNGQRRDFVSRSSDLMSQNPRSPIRNVPGSTVDARSQRPYFLRQNPFLVGSPDRIFHKCAIRHTRSNGLSHMFCFHGPSRLVYIFVHRLDYVLHESEST